MEYVLIVLLLFFVSLLLYRIRFHKFTKLNRENIGLSIVGILSAMSLSFQILSVVGILIFASLLAIFLIKAFIKN